MKMLRWRFIFVVSSTVLAALSTAKGQQVEAVTDALLVQDLAPELNNVQLGRVETLSDQRRRDAGGLDLRFRYEMDLNSDGQQELILMGSYAEHDRHRSFVLIARPGAGGWARSRLLTFDREFIIGQRFDNRLAVAFCTGCDQGGWIEWTGSDYEYRPF